MTITVLTCSLTLAQSDENKFNKKAAILSTACPGLGQIYNKKYWKTPIIYLALGSTMYYYLENDKKYNDYKSAYIARNDNDENTLDAFPDYTNNNLITLKDYYRNSRDLSLFLFLLSYFLNIIDASVDAHFMNYNLNDNLSLQLKPRNEEQNFAIINFSLKYNL